jgi:hypothetical protein
MPGADANADAGAEPNASASLLVSASASALLFSLQLFVADVRLSAVFEGSLLVGFQLLQFEIMLFERRELLGGVRLAMEHGKACLFEAEPAALAAQLCDEGAAPLVLLLMAQERDRARLVAFASVPLSLHVGLTADDALPVDMRHRVCEWARGNGTWELCNQQGDTVGSATGVVTLSCLGKTLAPHLRTALGVQVGCAPSASPVRQSPSASEGLSGNDSASKRQQQGIDVAGVEQGGGLREGVSDRPKEASAKVDEAVQCDNEDATSDGQAGRERIPEPVRFVGSRQMQQRSSVGSGHSTRGAEASRRCPTPERCGSPRRGAHNEAVNRSAAAGGISSPRSLPPPLFFQKQPASRKR